jgi:hypothetical protein
MFRLFAKDELIGDKPLARSSHSIFPICGGAGVRAARRLVYFIEIWARAGRWLLWWLLLPGHSNEKNERQEPRTAEFGGYRRRELSLLRLRPFLPQNGWRCQEREPRFRFTRLVWETAGRMQLCASVSCPPSNIGIRARPLPAPTAHTRTPAATDRSRTRGYRSDNHTPVSQIHRHTHAPHVIHAAALRRNTHCAHLWGCCSSRSTIMPHISTQHAHHGPR